MYSINVFLTFSLSMVGDAQVLAGASRATAGVAHQGRALRRRLALCLMILAITVVEKFAAGGWVTVTVTGALIALCFRVRAHYRPRRRGPTSSTGSSVTCRRRGTRATYGRHARPREADGGRAGVVLRRRRHPHAPQRLSLLSRLLPAGRLRLGRCGGLRRVQGRARGRGPGAAHAGNLESLRRSRFDARRDVASAGWGSAPTWSRRPRNCACRLPGNSPVRRSSADA